MYFDTLASPIVGSGQRKTEGVFGKILLKVVNFSALKC